MKVIKRTFAVIMTVVLLLTMIPLASISVNAAGQTSITLKQEEHLEYASNWGWDAVKMSADGKMVYCVQPDLSAPPSGEYRTDNGKLTEIKSTESKYNMYNKALYYCYGGDGFNTSNDAFKTNTNNHQLKYSGNTPSAFIGNLKYSQFGFEMIEPSGSNLHYLMTHALVSYIYYGDSTYKSKISGVKIPNDWYSATVELYNSIKAAPNPPVSAKLYMLNIGSTYQQVIIAKESIKLQLQKSSSNTTITKDNNCYSLKGAKYSIYLDSACKDDYFGYITVDENGYGHYGNGNVESNKNQGADVPVQTYYCKEVEAPKGYSLDKTIYQFKNSGKKTTDGTPIYSITCKDAPQNDPVDIMLKKVDKDGKGLANVEFTVKYYDGYYDNAEQLKDKTSLRSWVLKTDEDGYTHLSNEYLVSGDDFYYTSAENKTPILPLGTVTIKETKALDGYTIDNSVYVRQITSNDSTSDIVKTYNAPEIANYKSTGYVKVLKADSTTQKPVEGAVYGLYSSNDTDTNGDLLADKKISECTTDKDGYGVFSESVIVGTYFVQEISSPIGYVRNKTIYTVNVGSSNSTVETATVCHTTNTPVVAYINKVDEGGNNLPGSRLQVFDGTKVIDEWISTNISHVITGKLEVGKEYVLHEVSAPDGYIKASDVKFIASNNITVKMTDKKTTTQITKTDITGDNELEGAALTVTDENNKAVDNWVSKKQPHIIKGLIAGKEYILTEISAPDGYTIAKPIKFTVNTDGTVTKITMKDEKTVTLISKTDITGQNELEGAMLNVKDKDGNIVDEWVSGKESHRIEGLTAGEKYTLTEVASPAGYTIAQSIDFTVNSDGSVTNVIMINAQTVTLVTKTDITGEIEVEGATLSVSDENGKTIDKWISGKTAHTIKGLVAGKKYTLTEIAAPDGYIIAKPIDFTVNADGSVTKVTMKNEKTVTIISKTDVTGEKELEGATLIVTDEDDNVVNEWVSTKEPHTIEGLTAGKKYTLTEKISPAGYIIANSIEFTVNTDGTVTNVVMKDSTTKYSFIKVDDKGKAVENAVLQLLDKDGRIIEEWITDGNSHVIEGKLIVGETYTLHEKEAPEGYEKAKDYTFTVQNTEKVQEVKMVDIYKGKVEISTPDTPIPEDSSSNTSSVQTGQAYLAMIASIAIASLLTFYFSRRKRTKQ